MASLPSADTLDALTAEQRAAVQRAWAGVDACIEGSVGVEEGSKGEVNGWKEGGEAAVHDLLASHLGAAGSSSDMDSPAVLVVHYTLARLLDSALPASVITELLRGFAADAHIQVLQEAAVDVLESRVDLELDSSGEDLAVTPVAGRAAEILRSLLQSSFLPPLLTACLLDPLRLPSSSTTALTAAKLTQLERRRRTALCFRQTKFNLLREASEGWAGLVVLLSHPEVLGPEEVEEGGGENEVEERVAARRIRAARAWREITRLVGAYDLAPPRVLDVFIDAACVHLATHHRFFLALLEASPWTERDVGGEHRGDADLLSAPAQEAKGESVLRTWRFAERIKREQGCRMLTQVLGFKFGFYQESTRDLKGLERRVDATPKDLLLFTAIVMKRGWVRMLDILPYLGPDEKAMNMLARKFKSETQAKIIGLSGNALSAAGVLADDDAPSGAAGGEADKPPVESVPIVHVEQKVLLVQALLSVGHWAPALAMLARWPVIAHYHSAISDILLRMVRVMIEPAYRPLEAELAIASDGPGLAPARPSATDDLPKKSQATLVLPQPLDTVRTAFRYFYPRWLDDLPVCTDMAEVAERVRPFLRLVGPLGARDVQVLVWLCRIGIHQRQQDPSEEVTHAWTDIIRCTLLPSLPLLDCNVGYNNELWPLIQPFPYDFRYALYGEWDVALGDRLSKTYSPAMALAAAQSHVNVRSTLRRVTAGNERVAARALGKASTAAPTMLWTALLDQIKSYPNMIPSLAKAVSRYGSDLGWDVAMYMLLKTLSDTGRDRVKEDGLHAADWLQAVSTFVGVLSRSTDKLHLEPLLQLFANRLKAKSLADLIALQTLIYEMTGIEALHNISDTQVACFSGGPVLSEEGAQATRIEHTEPPRADADRAAQLKMDKRPERKLQYEKPTQRLISALVGSGLAQPILIAIAQLRKTSVFTATATARHTKQLSLKFDECDAIFQQYIGLLYAGMFADEKTYKAILPTFLPPLRAMHHDYGLDLAASFQLLRPKLYWQIYVNRSEILRLQLKRQHYRKDLTDEQAKLIQWNEAAIIPALLPVVVDVASCLEPNIRHYQLEPFISSFWQLSLGELEVPEKTYNEIIGRLQGMANTLTEWSKPGVALNRYWVDAYRSNKDQVNRRATALSEELAVQKTYYAATKERLDNEMKQWFTGSNQPSLDDPQPLKRKDFAALLHNTCFYPRAIVSIRDATFVAKFVRYLHDWNAERFSLLAVYEHFFDTKLGACLFACTETESASLGRFLNYLLVDAERWRRDEAAFNSEAIGPNPAKANVPLDGMKLVATRYVDWGSFKRLCRKWHNRVLTAVTTCLQSPDYMHIKNGITVALRLLPHFPKQKSMYEAFKKSLTQFQEKEASRPDKRDDLELAAKSLQSAIEIAARNPDFVVANDDFSPPPPGAKTATAAAPGMRRAGSGSNVAIATLGKIVSTDGAASSSAAATASTGSANQALSSQADPPLPDLAALRDQLAKNRAEKLKMASANGSTIPIPEHDVSVPVDAKPSGLPTGPPDAAAQVTSTQSATPRVSAEIRPGPSEPLQRPPDRRTEADRLQGSLSRDAPSATEYRRDTPAGASQREEPRGAPSKPNMPPPPAMRQGDRENDDMRRERPRPSEDIDRSRTRPGRYDAALRERTPPRDGRRTSPPRRPGSRAPSVESRSSKTSERRRSDRDRDADKRDQYDRSARDGRDRDDRKDRSDRRERRGSKSSKEVDSADKDRDRERRRTRDRDDKDRRDRHRSDRERAGDDAIRGADADRADGDRHRRDRDIGRHGDHDRNRDRDRRDRPSEHETRSRHDRRDEAPRQEPPRQDPQRTDVKRSEPPRLDPPRVDLLQSDAPRADAGRPDPRRVEQRRPELARSELGRSDPPRSEPPRSEPPRSEPPRSDPPRSEPPRSEAPRAAPQQAPPARPSTPQGNIAQSRVASRQRSPVRQAEAQRGDSASAPDGGRPRSLLDRMGIQPGGNGNDSPVRSRNGETPPGRTSRPSSPPRAGPRELLPNAPPTSTPTNGSASNGASASPVGFQVNGRASRSSALPRNASLPARPGGQAPPITPTGDRVSEMRGRDLQREGNRDGPTTPTGDGQGRKRPAEGSAREASATPRVDASEPPASAPAEQSPAASTPPPSAVSSTPSLPAKRPRLDREAANKRAQRTAEGEADAANGRQRGRLFEGLTGMKG